MPTSKRPAKRAAKSSKKGSARDGRAERATAGKSPKGGARAPTKQSPKAPAKSSKTSAKQSSKQSSKQGSKTSAKQSSKQGSKQGSKTSAAKRARDERPKKPKRAGEPAHERVAKRPARGPLRAVHRHPVLAPGTSRPLVEEPRASVLPSVSGSRPLTDDRSMDLDFGTTEVEGAVDSILDELSHRWTLKGEELLRRLAEQRCAGFEYRADLREGRFVWLDRAGEVAAEARSQVICSWSPSTHVVCMAWADPLLSSSSVPRVARMPAEHDDVDEEGSWRIAMQVADVIGAHYLYRVPTPHAHYFLALRELTFTPDRKAFVPTTPVGFVLRGLEETRGAIESRAEPSPIVRERLSALGEALLGQARFAYRSTDWVARLEATGKRLLGLAQRVPPGSFAGVLTGQASEWLSSELAEELRRALRHLEEEWTLFESVG